MACVNLIIQIIFVASMYKFYVYSAESAPESLIFNVSTTIPSSTTGDDEMHESVQNTITAAFSQSYQSTPKKKVATAIIGNRTATFLRSYRSRPPKIIASTIKGNQGTSNAGSQMTTTPVSTTEGAKKHSDEIATTPLSHQSTTLDKATTSARVSDHSYDFSNYNVTIQTMVSDQSKSTTSFDSRIIETEQDLNLRVYWFYKDNVNLQVNISWNGLNYNQELTAWKVEFENAVFNICPDYQNSQGPHIFMLPPDNNTCVKFENTSNVSGLFGGRSDSCRKTYNITVSTIYSDASETPSKKMLIRNTAILEPREPGSPHLATEPKIVFRNENVELIVKVNHPKENADCINNYCLVLRDVDNTTVTTINHPAPFASENFEISVNGESARNLEYCVTYRIYVWASKHECDFSSKNNNTPKYQQIIEENGPAAVQDVDAFTFTVNHNYYLLGTPYIVIKANALNETCINVNWTLPVKWTKCFEEYEISIDPPKESPVRVNRHISEKVLCNLRSGTEYKVQVSALKVSKQNTVKSDILSVFTLHESNETAGYIVIIVILSLIAFVILGIYFLKMRQQRVVHKRRPSSLFGKLGRRHSHPVKVRDLPKTTSDLLASAGHLLEMEFEDLNIISEAQRREICKCALTSENKIKNRYFNILPYEHSRVHLNKISEDPDSTYINASYIMGFNGSKEYIASQGPKNNTLEDFWRMIWEQNVHIIVMVTGLVERGKIKCDQYWPETGQAFTFSNLSVDYGCEYSTEILVKRTFKVQCGDNSREVLQFCFRDWPDFGCPVNPEILIRFIEIVRNSYLSIDTSGANSPILVHCSAGVGRTGTFIVVDWLMQEASAGQEIDIFSTTLQARSNRMKMVQCEEQYEYIYKCLSHYVTTRLLSLQGAFIDDADQECLIERNSIPLIDFENEANSTIHS